MSTAVLSTACGGGTPPATDAPTPTSSAAAEGEWTKVTAPKTVEGAFRSKPCDTLTPAQRTELGLPSEPKAGPAACSWSNYDNSRAEVKVELYSSTLLQKFGPQPPKAGSGLAVSKVAGYPAVRSIDGTDQRGCMVFAAISDTQTLRAYFTSYKTMPAITQDACGFAEKVLGAVIEKLPAAT